MKKYLLSFALVLMSYALADSDHYNKDKEPTKSFHEARRLLKEEKYEEAHVIHLWMFNNIDKCRPESFSLAVTNLTYDWHKVATKYPPAMKALLERRDERMKWMLEHGQDLKDSHYFETIEGERVIKPNASFLNQKICFTEVISINKWLKQEDRTVDFYKKLDLKLPDFSKAVYYHVADALYRQKEYELVGKYIVKPEWYIKSLSRVYKISKEAQGGLFAENAKKEFEDDIEKYVTIQLANGHDEQARKAKELALEIVDSPRIRELVK